VEGDAPSEVGALLGDVDASVEKLCALCDHYGFDGWLARGPSRNLLGTFS